jgi:hypothetical protein
MWRWLCRVADHPVGFALLVVLMMVAMFVCALLRQFG